MHTHNTDVLLMLTEKMLQIRRLFILLYVYVFNMRIMKVKLA